MNTTKQWAILNTSKDITPDSLLGVLLKNRGFMTKQEQDAFLDPGLKTVTLVSVGIDRKHVTKAIKRIREAIEKKQQIIVFGDYDVDGIAGTAILWETLHHIDATVTPYIPDRIEEGYGLSIAGIDNVLMQNPETKVIITVDNGIVANEAVSYANEKGIDVILTDHHTIGKKLPKAFAIIHTTLLCGTGVAYLFAKEIEEYENDHLALVSLATVADLVPLTGANRVLLAKGLEVLHHTKRPGIIALCEEAGIDQKTIGVYEIGHVIAPRLNAMGRIASAMDSLRLLCTKDRMRAKALAEKLGITNKERQLVTQSITEHAITKVKNGETKLKDLLIVSDSSYDEGVIGLVAGKLVETFYRPSIVLSLGKEKSKASARSIKGFNIIEFIRNAEHLLINAGGHPMAAGFTIETGKIGELEKFFAERLVIDDAILVRSLTIDCELSLEYVSQELYDNLQKLAPFGMGNSEPTFVSNATLINTQTVGKNKDHLKLKVKDNRGHEIYGIAFGMGEMFTKLKAGDRVHIVYTIDENEWNHKKSLQLKVKDIQDV